MDGTGGLVRFINVLGATVVGALVTGGVMWVLAREMGFGGGGIFYLFVFLVATVSSYRLVQKLTATHPIVRALAGVLGGAAILVFVANWRELGAEDPFVVVIIVAIFLGIAYWFTGTKHEKTPDSQ
jgi:O-antigen/teichoic acid export membrane protein